MLTMNIIEDILSDYDIESSISNGESVISAIRFSETSEHGFIQLVQSGDDVLCKSENGRILIHHADISVIADKLNEVLKQLNNWQASLHSLIFSGCSLQDLVDTSYPIIRNPIIIFDELDNIVAKTNHPKGSVDRIWDYVLSNGKLPYQKIMDIHYSDIYKEKKWSVEDPVPEVFLPPNVNLEYPSFCYRIPSKSKRTFVGDLVIIMSERKYSAALVQICTYFSQAIRKWSLYNDNSSILSSAHSLLTKLLDGEHVPVEEINTLLSMENILSDSYRLGCIPLGDWSTAYRMVNDAENKIRSHSLFYNGYLLLICPSEYSSDLIDIFRGLTKLYNLQFAISDSFSRWSSLKAQFELLKNALNSSDAKMIYPSSKTKVDYLFSLQSPQSANQLEVMHPAISLLKQYDRQYKTDYLNTLEIWLKNERSAAATCRAMFVHRNTLLHRLDRIQELTGECL